MLTCPILVYQFNIIGGCTSIGTCMGLMAHNTKKESIFLLNSFWDACVSLTGRESSLVQGKRDGSDIQKAIVEDNKGSSTATSITFL